MDRQAAVFLRLLNKDRWIIRHYNGNQKENGELAEARPQYASLQLGYSSPSPVWMQADKLLDGMEDACILRPASWLLLETLPAIRINKLVVTYSVGRHGE